MLPKMKIGWFRNMAGNHPEQLCGHKIKGRFKQLIVNVFIFHDRFLSNDPPLN
jgi:hypothetical protein